MYANEGLIFFLILLASCALTALCSYVASDSDSKRARIVVLAGVTINLAVLATFKYKLLLFPALTSRTHHGFNNFSRSGCRSESPSIPFTASAS